jgi:hypothetical protein
LTSELKTGVLNKKSRFEAAPRVAGSASPRWLLSAQNNLKSALDGDHAMKNEHSCDLEGF